MNFLYDEFLGIIITKCGFEIHISVNLAISLNGILLQQVKQLLATQESNVRVPVLVLAPSLWLQLPVNMPGKTVDDGPSA